MYFTSLITLIGLTKIGAFQHLSFQQLEALDDSSVLQGVQTVNNENVLDTIIQCAMECMRADVCSLFSYNYNSGMCKLYPPVIFPSGMMKTRVKDPGNTYFAYHTEWCPTSMAFLLDRKVNLCVRVSNNIVTWKEGVEKCEINGGQLLKLEDATSQSKIQDMIRNDASLLSEALWVGARDEEPSDNVDDFTWLDGTLAVNTFWADGQPDETLLPDGNCLTIENAMMYDQPCENRLRYMCQIRKPGTKGI